MLIVRKVALADRTGARALRPLEDAAEVEFMRADKTDAGILIVVLFKAGSTALVLVGEQRAHGGHLRVDRVRGGSSGGSGFRGIAPGNAVRISWTRERGWRLGGATGLHASLSSCTLGASNHWRSGRRAIFRAGVLVQEARGLLTMRCRWRGTGRLVALGHAKIEAAEIGKKSFACPANSRILLLRVLLRGHGAC
jgi:hypothetical protein